MPPINYITLVAPTYLFTYEPFCNEDMITPVFSVDACINWLFPIYIPQCPIPLYVLKSLKNTISPTCNCDFCILVPILYWAVAECGKFTPKFFNTYFVSPEQSNPFLGVSPP